MARIDECRFEVLVTIDIFASHTINDRLERPEFDTESTDAVIDDQFAVGPIEYLGFEPVPPRLELPLADYVDR